jgi:hypothetical protein
VLDVRIHRAHDLSVPARKFVAVFPSVETTTMHDSIGITPERVGRVPNEVCGGNNVITDTNRLMAERTWHVEVEERHPKPPFEPSSFARGLNFPDASNCR